MTHELQLAYLVISIFLLLIVALALPERRPRRR